MKDCAFNLSTRGTTKQVCLSFSSFAFAFQLMVLKTQSEKSSMNAPGGGWMAFCHSRWKDSNGLSFEWCHSTPMSQQGGQAVILWPSDTRAGMKRDLEHFLLLTIFTLKHPDIKPAQTTQKGKWFVKNHLVRKWQQQLGEAEATKMLIRLLLPCKLNEVIGACRHLFKCHFTGLSGWKFIII